MPRSSNGYDPRRHGPFRVVGPGFFERVYAVVQQVPPGRVTTYGAVAAALGLRSVARKVGHALAALPEGRDDVPWHRVVGAGGQVSRDVGSGSGKEQAARLRREGVAVDARGRIAGFARVCFDPSQPADASGTEDPQGRRESAVSAASGRRSGRTRRGPAH